MWNERNVTLKGRRVIFRIDLKVLICNGQYKLFPSVFVGWRTSSQACLAITLDVFILLSCLPI